MKSVIVGTAGHIDHGKTALVKALTGIDADRLQEEKRRGITIDIGFAHLELPSPNGEILRLGFVDVPGHERFIRNMLAGIGGIDFVLLVIAADEGIKPQTREHFDICRLLAVRQGITVLTKADAVDADTLEVVRLEAEDFLRGSFLDPAHSPIVAVSSLTGAGLDKLKSLLATAAGEVSAKIPTALARLPIDRVFTMKGFGTVVTGTLVSGTIRKEDELEVFPAGKRVRVRGVQVHGDTADQAVAGQRTALNLAGASTVELARGMTLAPPGTFQNTSRIDVSVSLLQSARPMKDRAHVHFHAYTTEAIAEVSLYGEKEAAPGGESFAQLKLAEPALLLPGDRFILRQFSPVVTIGGGVVLDAAPLRKMPERAAFLKILMEGDRRSILHARIARKQHEGLSRSRLTAETGWRPQNIDRELDELIVRGSIVRVGELLVDGPAIESLGAVVTRSIESFHAKNPLVPGMGKEELREVVGASPGILASVLERLAQEKRISLTGELVHLPGRGVVMQDEEAESKTIIEQAFSSAGLKVPSLREVLAGLKVDKGRAQKIVTLLLRDRVLVKIAEDLVFHQSAVSALRQKISGLKATTPKIDVARFKDLTGVSRKYAIPLLEYLDRERVTKRVGDERVIL
ncbi:MAG TPA: selenocysteine-specific translation elongation factor [Terriglobales bacterium]|nr:selenocysteine-specific translation elongation factor [Terriglobales bacterium]